VDVELDVVVVAVVFVYPDDVREHDYDSD